MSLSDKSFKKVLDVALGYGAGYGNCEIKQTPNYIIFEFYNGGWSQCEEEDQILMRKVKPIIDDHPMSVYIFNKGYLAPDLYVGLKTTKIKKYVYKIERN